MHIEQIDRYCDLFEERLKHGEALTASQFLEEQRLPAERQLRTELEKLEREYRADPAGARRAVVMSDPDGVESRPVRRASRALPARPTMPTASIDELEQAILRAGILSHQELGDALAQLPPDTREAGPETVAQEFVRRGRLTEFQKQMLLAGQSDGLVLGEYTLLSLLGAGGMGRVFRALHRRMGREVALKVLPERLVAQEEAVQRFEREVRVAARLVHPNVVTAYDAGEHQGMHYLVMEYVAGADLASVVRSLGPLSVADALRCALQAAAGLAYAHGQGVTHRDIKPGNLLLDAQGAVKVLDLGLARMRAALPGQSDSLSASGAVMGTVDFMPPEQALNAKSADERSDIYSLGCTLHFLLTGRPVYEGDTIMEKLLAHREAPIPSLRERLPNVSPQLDAVVTRMLAKNPAERFATMTEAGDALRQCLLATGEEFDFAVRAAGRLGSVGIKAASAQETRDYMVERSIMSTQIAAPPTYVPTGSQMRVETAPPPPRRRTWLVGGLAALLLIAAGVVVRLQFADGTLVIEVREPGAEILVDGALVATVKSADKQRIYRISVDRGRRLVKVRTKEGHEFFSQEVIVAAGKETDLFRASIVDTPPAPPPADGGADHVLSVAQDGSAEFTSLTAALEAAQPGMTIRVVDGGEYTEQIDLQIPGRFSRLTLEATNRATLVSPVGGAAVAVKGIEGVTIRGFRVRVAQMPSFGIGIIGSSPGCVLEDLEFVGSSGGWQGVALEGLSVPEDAPPVVIQGCRFESLYIGLRVSGLEKDYKTPMGCRGVLIADNVFKNCVGAVSLIGAIRDMAVVGNRVINCPMAGVQFENLVDDAAGNAPRRLLVANNTFLDCATSLKVWDDQVRPDAVTVQANLVLSPSGVDWQFVDSGDHPTNPRGPGDGKQIREKWHVGSNWRETSPPQGTTIFERAWIPQAETDVLRVPIDVRSRDAAKPEFLQPAADSPLASAGAGESEGLPAWVGAVPPPGAPDWDWNKAWQNLTRIDPVGDGVLTVAKDGTGEFTSLKAALDVAPPGATIRVLDAAEYEESLLLRNRRRHENVTIEATRRATLIAPQNGVAVSVIDVGGVNLKGFDLRVPSEPAIGIVLGGNCGGCDVEDMQFRGTSGQPITKIGISLEGLSILPGSEPVAVRRCRFEALSTCVRVSGLQDDLRTPVLCRGALIVDNDFVGNVGGVHLYGAVRDTVVVGNRFIGATMNGVQFARLLPDAAGQQPGRLLVANNTFFDCSGSLILWDDDVRGTNVAVRNNLILSPVGVDWMFVETDDPSVPKGPGDGKKVLERWNLTHNWREMTPPQGTSLREQAWIPRAEQDVLQETIAVASRREADPDFLQPTADSPLATSGAGESEGLPSYVGAVAPPGAPRWDWRQTWELWTRTDPAEDGILTVATDGSAEFTSLKSALDAAKAGLTIRVVDKAEYADPLVLRLPRRHENITLEATHRATLTAPAGGNAITVLGISGITVRGFRISAPAAGASGMRLAADCRGCVIEDVQFEGSTETPVTEGVALVGLTIPADSEPVRVRRCTFRSLGVSLRVSGMDDDYKTPLPCRGALITENLFVENAVGLIIGGAVHDSVVAGNRFVSSVVTGVQLENLLDGSNGVPPGRLLVANNTFLECAGSFSVWDDDIRGEKIAVRSNLFLGPRGPDCRFIDSGDHPQVPRGPGDGKKVLERWTVAGNWREPFQPTGNQLMDQSLIPAGPTDVMQEQIAVASRDEAEPAFLQPAADSPLATGGSGAGVGLPSFVGAVAPAGATGWDWNTTWQTWLKEE